MHLPKFPYLEKAAKGILRYAPHWRNAPTYTERVRHMAHLQELREYISSDVPLTFAEFGPGGIVQKVLDSPQIQKLPKRAQRLAEATARHFTMRDFTVFESDEIRHLFAKQIEYMYIIDRSTRVLDALRAKQYDRTVLLDVDLERQILTDMPLVDVAISYNVIARNDEQAKVLCNIAHSVNKGGVLSIEDDSLQLPLNNYGYDKIGRWLYVRNEIVGPTHTSVTGKLDKAVRFKPAVGLNHIDAAAKAALHASAKDGPVRVDIEHLNDESRLALEKIERKRKN
ncbi:MAG TPA: hypothetical protein VK158_03070 [Acidobacteriota bacterium]|nr:hypothetical protein [Acidobacteriota bacterium]